MKFQTIALTCTLAVLGGCAAPASVSNMSVHTGRPVQANSSLRNNVAISDVTGGKETNPMWTSQVSSQAFRSALEESLTSVGMFSKVLAGSKYRLVADLQKLDQPMIGLDLTVTSTVRYSLIEIQSNKEIYARTINSPFTAGFSDSPMATTRLKIANEGAIRKNIEQLINDLMAVNPSSSPN